jgi:propionyl-CoA synthetase
MLPRLIGITVLLALLVRKTIHTYPMKRSVTAWGLFTKETAAAALRDPTAYWGNAAKGIHFDTPYTSVLSTSASNPTGTWFGGGTLNVCHNAVDRHVQDGRGKQPAIHYESPLTNRRETLTYRDLQSKVSDMAHVLSAHGVQAGDTVLVYMSNAPEAVVAMLASARIGATHSVVFGGFAAPELAKRIADCKPRVVVCSSWGIEPTRIISYKRLVDEALGLSTWKDVKVLVNQRVGVPIAQLEQGRDYDLEAELRSHRSKPLAPCVPVPSEQPLYLLYTSGTTGAPKGIARDTAGIAVMLHETANSLFGLEKDSNDCIFTTSDIGWIVGHNYIVYAPLLRGVPTVLYEGKPVGTPDAGAFFSVVERYGVTALSSSPTAFRAIRAADPEGHFKRRYDTSSLKRAYLAGERSDPVTLEWAQKLLGVPVIDNWWQTETGSPITSAPAAADGSVWTKLGSAGIGCPGWDVRVARPRTPAPEGDEDLGELVIKLPLPPGALTGIWGRPRGLEHLYLNDHAGYFSTFDAGHVDEDGFVSVMTRTDDVINVAGHRLSTGELEQTVTLHPHVAEAAVVGVRDTIKGEVPWVVAVLTQGAPLEEKLICREVDDLLRKHMGPIASARVVVAKRLPKTRSGKVVRKLIRQLLQNEPATPPPTLEDASVVDELRAVLTPRGTTTNPAEQKMTPVAVQP